MAARVASGDDRGTFHPRRTEMLLFVLAAALITLALAAVTYRTADIARRQGGAAPFSPTYRAYGA
jgi:hypothetical protein